MPLYAKLVMYAGLFFNIMGTILVGLIGSGVPRRGDVAKAPKRKPVFVGWIALMVGFFLQMLATCMS